MTDWVPFEEDYGCYDEDGQFLGDSVSEAISASVQQSVSRALEVSVPQQISQGLVVALNPFTQQLEVFAKKQNLVPFQEGNSAVGRPSFRNTSKDAPSAWPHDGVMATLQHPSSEDLQYCSVPSASSVFPRGVRVSLNSDPNWALAQEMAENLHGKLHRSFDKEVRNRLRAECPRPELPEKVAETPEIDASMLTFLKKIAKDPKKGIDRAW
ncbi:hypothetical protein NDU88_001264 [Pleurodeles waltl]|uniref:Uncharacterized protein n=1 Tax=Pleurodeles waltl TaxID=8319 RepID=A0AAV7U6E0_PLEWA|nr:hypothetical protein NDU88_001264 [Pleurodeles waltl]